MQNNMVELTFKSIVLSIIITLLLASANAYLGLKVGITVSASIPAAVIGMGILRFFKFHNVYEINMVQTAASAGECLAAGMIFSLPALIMIQYWDAFNYWQASTIALLGGVLGVLFSVPLRRVLLNDKNLKFPEGTAIGNVLKISQDKSLSLDYLLIGGATGAIIGFLQGGLKILSGGIQYWSKVSSTIMGVGLGFNPALIGAGFIVGPRVAMSMLAGVVIGWSILVPILAPLNGHSLMDMSAQALALDVWKNQTRFVGLGVLLIAGLWTLATLLKPIAQGMMASLHSIAFVREHGYDKLPRQEQDFPIHWVLVSIVLLILPVIFTLLFTTNMAEWMPSHLGQFGMILITTAYVLLAGFIFASICGYLVGMVGSSASPISAMSLAAILIYSVMIFFLLKLFHFEFDGNTLSLSALAIMVVAFISCISAITNDTMQDFKAGHMIDATPWKQQLVMILGVVVAAYSLPWVMDLLYNAYGVGDVLPRAGMDVNEALAAPQAQLMAAISQGVFMQNMSWTYIEIGAGIAVAGIITDRFIQRFGWSLPTLGIGMGIYLPLESASAIVLGGIVAWVASRKPHPDHHRGIMLASGLVAGAALVGIVLAVPFVVFQNTDALRVMPIHWDVLAQLLGLAVTLGLCAYMFKSE